MTTPSPWRKSTYSSGTGSCVEMRSDIDGIQVRNSNHPDAGTLTFTPAQMRAWLAGVTAGLIDDLT